MKFNCNKQELNTALNIVSKGISIRTTIPTLKGILLEVKDDYLLMTASDMEITVQNKIKVSNTSSGSIVVPSKLFTDIVRKLPNDEIKVEVDNENIRISCLNSEFNLVGMSADEFPNIINTDNETDRISLDRKLFNNMIKKTSFSASIDQTKPTLTGILIEFGKENLSLVAIDGYRMALAKEKYISENEKEVIISAKIMNEISKILTETEGKTDSDIELIIDSKSAVFNLEDIRITARLISGKFINYKDIIPKSSPIEVTVNKNILSECIERASLLSKEGKNNLIKFNIRDNIINITSNSEEGNVTEDIAVVKTGDDLEIGFNSKYILDILKVIDDDEVLMKFEMPTAPCLIDPVNSDSYEYLLLPVRITNI